MAGVAGVDPGPYKLRHLQWMARAKAELAWNQTSSLMALVHNGLVAMAGGQNILDASAFNPLATSEPDRPRPPMAKDLTILEKVFCD